MKHGIWILDITDQEFEDFYGKRIARCPWILSLLAFALGTVIFHVAAGFTVALAVGSCLAVFVFLFTSIHLRSEAKRLREVRKKYPRYQ